MKIAMLLIGLRFLIFTFLILLPTFLYQWYLIDAESVFLLVIGIFGLGITYLVSSFYGIYNRRKLFTFILPVSVLLLLAFFYLTQYQMKLNRVNEERLVASLEKFKAENEYYPSSLALLTPKYI